MGSEGDSKMKRYSPEQTVAKLRQADRELGKGLSVKEVCRKIEVSEQTYYRWRQKYGGMSPELIKELKALQKENARLRKIIADQRIDMEIMKEAIEISSKNL
jgi:putative transposase